MSRMTAEENHYWNLLMTMDALLFHLREIMDDHKNCPGCRLCWDAQGMEYTIEGYFGSLLGEAPVNALARFKKETEEDVEDLAILGLSPPCPAAPADAPLVLSIG